MTKDNYQKELINKAKETINILKSREQQDDNTLNITGGFTGNIVRCHVSGSVTSNISNKNIRE